MIKKTSELYVDDDGYICFDHTINRNIVVVWTLHSYGWEVFLGEVSLYEFEDDYITYPSSNMFSRIENIFSVIRTTDFGNWEVSWISNESFCREHKQFEDFEDAFSLYQKLLAEGELE